MTRTVVTCEILVSGLRRLGVTPGGVLLVHSSLKSLGTVEGGPETVIAALQEVITPDGTLVMPAFSYGEIGPEQPRFDVRHTRSCTGLITEVFRTMPGVRRSLHPTHSLAAWGRLREVIVEGHELCTTPGPPGSPFHRIDQHGGQILFLGAGLQVNTMLHCCEEWAPRPESLEAKTEHLEVVDYCGRAIAVALNRHRDGTSRHYGKIEPLLQQWGCMRVGRIGQATCRLVDSRLMVDHILQLLREVDRDFLAHDRLPGEDPPGRVSP